MTSAKYALKYTFTTSYLSTTGTSMPSSDIARDIGHRIRADRARLQLTRKDLARAAEVSERYLNELENGEANASLGILAKVAAALGQDLSSLLFASSVTARHDGFDALASGMSPSERESAIPILQQFLAERRRSARGLALLGLRGAGKSTLGRMLSAHLRLPFVSITREIEARAGMSLGDLFNLGGPDAYRALENDVVAEIVRRTSPMVVETAGGIVGNSQALDVIFASFKTVWLKASPAEHLARVAGQGDTRPMRGNPRALEHLKALLAQRETEYARAECTLDTSGRSMEDCFAELQDIAATIPALHAA